MYSRAATTPRGADLRGHGLAAREMCSDSGASPAFLSASASAVQTFDGEPLLHAPSSCMMGAVVFWPPIF
jgi:hypothetical protein